MTSVLFLSTNVPRVTTMSDTEGTRLPRVINQAFREDIVRAYNICLKYEEELEGELKAGRDAKRELVQCRIVGYLFHHSPTNEALETVVNEVLLCVNREDLLKLGRMYFDYLYQYVMDGYETMDYEAESPPPFDPLDEVAQRVMNKTSLDTTTAHNKALVRDGFNCVLSGAHDHACLRKSGDLRRKFPSEVRDWGFTVCVYIIKEIHSKSGSKEEDISNVHTVLERFGYEKLLVELRGAKFHRLENVLTVTSDIRSVFDKMFLWFAETTDPHTYKVKTGGPLRPDLFRKMYSLPDYVTFTTPDEDKLPLPSPSYLKLHAAVCEIGDLSGATGYMQQFHMGLETLLAKNPMGVDNTLSYVFRHADMT